MIALVLPIEDEFHPFPDGSYMVPLDKFLKKAYTSLFHTTRSKECDMRLKKYYRDFIADLEAKGRAGKTILRNELYLYGSLSHSIHGIAPEKLTYKHYLQVIEAGKKHGKYGAVETARVFKQFLHFLNTQGVKTGIHWRDLKSPRTPRKPVEYLTKEEIGKIRAFFPKTIEGIRTLAMFELGLSTGMRIGEIVSLDRRDVNMTAKTLMVINIKTGATDRLSFTQRALEAITSYLNARTDDDDCLFYSLGRGRLKTVTARYTLTKYEKELNLGKPIYWNLLRKSFISHLVFGGMEIKEVQSKARHADPVVTLRHYTALRDEEATKKQIDIMEGI